MTIRQSLINATSSLQNTSQSPSLDAEVLLSYVLNISREKLIRNFNSLITTRQNIKYNQLISRRKKHEPIAYIINKKEFYNLNFYVDKHVLIPRPETELMVEEVLRIIKSKKQNIKQILLADVGTGSGCVAIAIAKNYFNCKIFAIDKSKNALTVARKNIINHKLQTEISLLHGNLLTPLKNNVDIITANLPYLTTKQIKATKPDVSNFEPTLALLAENSEIVLYDKLLKQAPNYLNQNGIILLEIDPSFSQKIIKLSEKYFPTSKIIIKKDLRKKDRLAIIET